MNPKPSIFVSALLALALSAPAASAARAPSSYAGMAPQGPTSDRDYELMKSSGVSSVRLPMYWAGIQSDTPYVSEPDFDGFDHDVKVAAENDIRIMPFIWGSPDWAAGESVDLPVETSWQRRGWLTFVRDAVDRYGPYGSFWLEHSAVPYMPIRTWEIWNEENIVTFSNSTNAAQYAKLLRISGRLLHEQDPGARVLAGGLFGRPLQIPPNTASGDYLSSLYRAGNVKPYFDGVALHPYVAEAGAMRAQIRNLRRIMRVHHDAHTPLYLTELGWGSDSNESRWERGLQGQAREINEAMSMLVVNRRAWRIGGVWWFSWADLNDSCQFCDSAGLLTIDREAKPAWYLFNAWTGGDPDTVPRLSADGAKDPAEPVDPGSFGD
jgi:hypothetical protein